MTKLIELDHICHVWFSVGGVGALGNSSSPSADSSADSFITPISPSADSFISSSSESIGAGGAMVESKARAEKIRSNFSAHNTELVVRDNASICLPDTGLFFENPNTAFLPKPK